MNKGTGAVIIGRNEGERLKRSIQSALPHFETIVYVDSGSSDNSIEYARENNCLVVELDTTIPFTAARARNAGFNQLVHSSVDLEYVQFMDGDCELQSSWPSAAINFIEQTAQVAAVCGRRRERFPEASVYNQLCDWEWAIPPGEIQYCGGDVLMNAEAFAQVDGFRESMIAGEEPELCVRLRQVGWRIFCIDEEMTLHDAAMLKFSQWWQRAKRSGFAYATGTWLHGSGKERMWRRQSLRIWLWAFCIPVATFFSAVFFGWWGFLPLIAYPIQLSRSYFREAGDSSERQIRTLFNNLSRFPELAGQMSFIKRSLTGEQKLIEYK